MIDCLIPARAGSKGIKNKNITLINGIPLIAYSIHIAKMCNLVRNVYVSTDCEKIAKIARNYGALTPFIRPKCFAEDNSTDLEVFKHFFDSLDKSGSTLTEEILHLRPTTPFREVDIIDLAIKKFKDSNEFTSLRSAHVSNYCPFKWFELEGKLFYPIIKNQNNDEIQNKPRQNFPLVYIPNGYVDIVKKSIFREGKIFHGNKIMAFITKSVPDIDLSSDLLSAKNNPNLQLIAKSIKSKI